MQWIDVVSDGQIGPGEYEVLELEDTAVAVFNIDGQYYAIEDLCTHDGEELAGGPVEGDQVICPRHGARFCIRTGAALTPPAYEPVASFEVRLHEGMVQVLLDAELAGG